jgi:SPX domain protein involved in polyphosphate accumulation
MSYRKEKKYRLSLSDLAYLKNHLLSKGMKSLFPQRVIKSCYFDTENLTLYHESEEGVLPRKKIRIRWYNNEKIYTKEVKISSIEGRFKYTKDQKSIDTFEQIVDTQFFDKNYGLVRPSLMVSYEREYFEFLNMRLTFDTNVSYRHLRSHFAKTFKDPECVMEVKVPMSCTDDYIEGLINHPTSRFSKYSRGLLFSDGML